MLLNFAERFQELHECSWQWFKQRKVAREKSQSLANNTKTSMPACWCCLFTMRHFFVPRASKRPGGCESGWHTYG
ncbi:hypothetical protein BC938DRAFT_482051 [Jimgerdemannia flammicorona]|uniref:Uncharacterized protein n=1 Tax=Jimgerdemannia flammicorona TaxID=994334 RepID=A0A433QEY3_9FUNG|nr:hypothetical protein BC938DRAFT_482051 [Jimgerdemannia flammicorona]